MRDRGSAILIENDSIALIKRTRDGEEYYVFPGGGIEAGESPKEAAIREAYEELGVTIKIKDLMVVIPYNGTQYFFDAKIVDGEFGTGNGEEFSAERNRGTYQPIWLPIAEFRNYDIRPKEVMDAVIKRGI